MKSWQGHYSIKSGCHRKLLCEPAFVTNIPFTHYGVLSGIGCQLKPQLHCPVRVKGNGNRDLKNSPFSRTWRWGWWGPRSLSVMHPSACCREVACARRVESMLTSRGNQDTSWGRLVTVVNMEMHNNGNIVIQKGTLWCNIQASHHAAGAGCSPTVTL